jgi:hypothetical protein
MYRYSPFVVTSLVDRASRSIYRGLYTVGGYDEEYFPYMGGRIIYGLVHHLHLRRYVITHFNMYFVFLF